MRYAHKRVAIKTSEFTPFCSITKNDLAFLLFQQCWILWIRPWLSTFMTRWTTRAWLYIKYDQTNDHIAAIFCPLCWTLCRIPCYDQCAAIYQSFYIYEGRLNQLWDLTFIWWGDFSTLSYVKYTTMDEYLNKFV